MVSKLLVIVGSTRPGRAADLVVPWVTSRARAHGGFDVEVEAVPLRNTVVIPFVRTAFGPDGEPSDPETGIRLQVMLDDLAWWSAALKTARAAGQLTPGTLRVRAALAAAQA
jgi:NADPH-dependent FMN reductase